MPAAVEIATLESYHRDKFAQRGGTHSIPPMCKWDVLFCDFLKNRFLFLEKQVDEECQA